MTGQVPNIPLEEMTLRQLRRVASEYEVSRYSRMRKVELVAAIKQKQIAAGVLPAPSESAPSQNEVSAETSPAVQPSASRTDSVPSPRPVTAQASTDTVSSIPTTASSSTDTTEGTTYMQTAPSSVTSSATLTREELATVDDGLGDLPGGYGESRVVLLPRDPQWSYAYWDIPNEHKQELRSQGGERFALRLYDVTDIDINYQRPHSLQQFECDEMTRDWYLPIPVSDRDYAVEVGYVCGDGRWLMLTRSAPVRIPPVYPSDWIEDKFLTIGWNEELRGRTFAKLVPPSQRATSAEQQESNTLYDDLFARMQSTEAMRIAGSLFGSMHQAPEQAVSSFVFPSSAGLWALPTASGINMSGAGMFASAPPPKPRKFWLIADAELIVYGATEPDATVTVDGEKIELEPDGTFRFHVSFQDGKLHYPIVAVASDGEQTRSIRMDFERQTPSRHTNTKEEAVEEWFV